MEDDLTIEQLAEGLLDVAALATPALEKAGGALATIQESAGGLAPSVAAVRESKKMINLECDLEKAKVEISILRKQVADRGSKSKRSCGVCKYLLMAIAALLTIGTLAVNVTQVNPVALGHAIARKTSFAGSMSAVGNPEHWDMHQCPSPQESKAQTTSIYNAESRLAEVEIRLGIVEKTTETTVQDHSMLASRVEAAGRMSRSRTSLVSSDGYNSDGSDSSTYSGPDLKPTDESDDEEVISMQELREQYELMLTHAAQRVPSQPSHNKGATSKAATIASSSTPRVASSEQTNDDDFVVSDVAANDASNKQDGETADVQSVAPESVLAAMLREKLHRTQDAHESVSKQAITKCASSV